MKELPNRLPLLFTLATMPEESFQWFVAWAGGHPMVYPDGLGGFRPDSRQSIEALRVAAREYIDAATKET